MIKRWSLVFVALIVVALPFGAVSAQTYNSGTDFTYQGFITDGGTPITNTCNLQFSLFNALAAGTQIGTTQTVTGASVVGGVFTVTLDFGVVAFDGQDHWLEIGVDCPVDGTYTTLTPRKALTPAPYAIALYGMRTEPNATSPNVIGGFLLNTMTSGVVGGTISGGGLASQTNRVTDDYGTVGGGGNNQAGDNAGTTSDRTYATVGGGLQNTASGSVSTVGGGLQNTASGIVSTVGGGFNNTASSTYATVGGGDNNAASGVRSTVGGGFSNTASGAISTVGGGQSNSASGDYSTVGGGDSNSASGSSSTVGGGRANTASGFVSTVGGGFGNSAAANYSTIPGGLFNTINAGADFSFAAGYDADVVNAAHDNSFVWSGSTSGTDSWGAGTFTARAPGGVRFYTNVSNTTSGVQLATNGGAWASLSDRNAKNSFSAVDPRAILETLADIDISTWNYNGQDASIRHIGPVAQDFYAAFGVGENDTHITTVDADGVALASIQGLYAIFQEQEASINALQTRINQLEAAAADNNGFASLFMGGFGMVMMVGMFAYQRRKGHR